MNAPLPLKVTQALAKTQGQAVSRASNPVAGTLAQRLAENTRGEVLFGPADRARYATDASIYQVVPTGVFVPQTHADVQTALAICADLKVPLVPRGGGTSQCGQTVGTGLVIDHSKYLRHIEHLDLERREVTVQSGMVLDHLNAQLKPHGLWFPVDVSTSAQATLGGMAGNNSCGSRSIAYGNMVHNVRGANVLLSNGQNLNLGVHSHATGAELQLGQTIQGLAAHLLPELHEHWPKVMRRVGGYNLDIFHNQSERPYTADGSVNLAHLFIGSEGTLGLTQSLTLAITDLPAAKVLGVVNFSSFYKAMDSAQHIARLSPSAIELVDRTMIELALQNPAFAPTMRTALQGMPEAILLVEFSGQSKPALLGQLAQLVELMGDLGLANSVVEMTAEAPQKNLWNVRKAGLNIMMSLKGDGKPVSFIEDCAVPLVHLADYTAALTEVFKKHGSRGTWYAHASVGTLHVRPILDMRRGGAATMRAIAEEASALVRQYKGAYSGEHGDGLCRGEWIAWQFGPQINAAFEAIKAHLDPSGMLCPGRMVGTPAHPLPRMDDAALLRYPPSYSVIPIQTALNWQAWNVQNDPVTEQTTAPGTGGDSAEGFAKAAEMCNNNGHCRQFDAGTMCPSYRVTRDEKHLTRGRANTLRMALSGQLGPEGLASEAVHEAMDLCVGCKGCKRECPTGVDMAKMKIEFLHHYKAKHGHTLKDRLIAHLPAYAHWGARLGPLLNLRNRFKALAWLGEKCLGLSAKRSLPEWQRRTAFNEPAGQRAGPASGAASARLSSYTVSREAALASDKAVVLFVDTFNGTFESANALAAARVLHAAGYAVWVAAKGGDAGGNAPPNTGHLCCGRTYLAAGMVGQARTRVQALIDAVLPFAQKGVAIVGLEPSCLFTLRDEALSMDLGDAAITVSKQALMIEEFLAREASAGRLQTLTEKLAPLDAPLLVHGHCHQKAFDALSPLLKVLSLIPKAKPQLIESSCCGMAGSFGYEAAHHAVSMQMAELTLLPAIRQQAGAIVVADGTSCRHQILDGTGRQAIHAVALLARQLGA